MNQNTLDPTAIEVQIMVHKDEIRDLYKRLILSRRLRYAGTDFKPDNYFVKEEDVQLLKI